MSRPSRRPKIHPVPSVILWEVWTAHRVRAFSAFASAAAGSAATTSPSTTVRSRPGVRQFRSSAIWSSTTLTCSGRQFAGEADDLPRHPRLELQALDGCPHVRESVVEVDRIGHQVLRGDGVDLEGDGELGGGVLPHRQLASAQFSDMGVAGGCVLGEGVALLAVLECPGAGDHQAGCGGSAGGGQVVLRGPQQRLGGGDLRRLWGCCGRHGESLPYTSSNIQRWVRGGLDRSRRLAGRPARSVTGGWGSGAGQWQLSGRPQWPAPESAGTASAIRSGVAGPLIVMVPGTGCSGPPLRDQRADQVTATLA